MHPNDILKLVNEKKPESVGDVASNEESTPRNGISDDVNENNVFFTQHSFLFTFELTHFANSTSVTESDHASEKNGDDVIHSFFQKCHKHRICSRCFNF